MKDRSVVGIVAFALVLIVGLAYFVGRVTGRVGIDDLPAPTATATAEPTSTLTATESSTGWTEPKNESGLSSEEVEQEVEATRSLVRTFVADYYGHVPGNQWADIKGKVTGLTSARFLAESHPDDYLPVDDLELDRELRHDVEAVLDTMVFEGDNLATGPVDFAMSLGVTSYTADDQIDGYTVLPRVLVVELRRSGTDAWVVDGVTFID